MQLVHEHQYAVESFSLAERDRRWGVVRSLMESAGIDLLVVPDENNSRYLTQMAYDIGPTILPLDGEVTALTNHGRVGSAAASWINDFRHWNRRWAAGIVERLQELNADRKIVGVVGLDGLMRRPDGDLNYNTFVAMREVFPHARWVGAGELMQQARYVKSAEEVAFLTRAARATDAGLLAAAERMEPGITDRELWGHMVLAMVRAGGDPPRFAHFGIAPMRDIRGFPIKPIGHPAATGDMLFNEIDGRYAGYDAQGVQPVILGPLPPEWAEAWKVHTDAWDRTWAVLRPGARFADVEAAVRPAASGRFGVRQTLRGRGVGDDIPLITSSSSTAGRMRELVLEEGVCFVLKPYATWADAHGAKELNWGDTVVITRDGARRLGERPHELIIRG
jgi:Xaa-Pro dipeptidase